MTLKSPRYEIDECPDCGGEKHIKSERCQECSGKLQSGQNNGNWKGGPKPRKSRHNPDELAQIPFADMTKGQRISAVKWGLLPPVRSERDRFLRSRYGWLLEDFDQTLEEQGGHCATCPKGPDETILYVDHDHKTGEPRGILCPGCNTLCGVIENAGPLLIAVVQYLAAHDSEHAAPWLMSMAASVGPIPLQDCG